MLETAVGVIVFQEVVDDHLLNFVPQPAMTFMGREVVVLFKTDTTHSHTGCFRHDESLSKNNTNSIKCPLIYGKNHDHEDI